MYKKILIAIDATGESLPVLQKGRLLAEQCGAEISVLHVMEQPYINYAYGELVAQQYLPSVDELKEQITPTLHAQLNEAGISHSHLHIELGAPVDNIIERAKEDGFDALVIGSHGRHGLQLLLGSTANGVLHHAKCDVLAVRVFN
jgi:universal stress protein A